MKRSILAAVLLAATSAAAFAQTSADHEAHHPSQSATPTPAQPPASGGQPGMGGPQGMMGGGMMNMMGGNMPMAGMMQMMGQMGQGMGMPACGPSGMATIDRVEGRIAFLRTELKITDAQASAWNAFADALRANAKTLGEIRASMMPQAGTAPQTLAERLTVQEKWLAARLDGTRAMKAAVTGLYAALSDDQKKTADEILAPHMGMMAMMSGMQSGQMGPNRIGPGQSGQMGSGQMGPGQMQPGQMMPGR